MSRPFPPERVPARTAPPHAAGRRASMIVTGIGVPASLAVFPAILALAGVPGIQAGPVCLATTIHPGASHALPPVTVQDKGSGDESIALHVQKVPRPSAVWGKPVPASWVTFTYPRKWLVLSQSAVPLGPGATAAVPASLSVPSSAAPGSYVAWIGAAPAGGGTAGHLNLATEAFTYLEFTVTRPGSPPRHAVCLSPGVKQASSAKPAGRAGRATAHPPRHPAAKGHLVPRKLRKYVPAAIIVGLVVGALAFLRRRGWL